MFTKARAYIKERSQIVTGQAKYRDMKKENMIESLLRVISGCILALTCDKMDHCVTLRLGTM
jgi:hypothetical protein